VVEARAAVLKPPTIIAAMATRSVSVGGVWAAGDNSRFNSSFLGFWT